MAKQEVSGVQVQMAASAGVKLLQQDDLMVPLSIAKSGALSVLEGMLGALANGEVVLTNAPPTPLPGAAQPPQAPQASTEEGAQEAAPGAPQTEAPVAEDPPAQE